MREAKPRGKVLIVAEFKKVLTLHLGTILSEDAAPARWGIVAKRKRAEG
jgi:hypothetical protein